LKTVQTEAYIPAFSKAVGTTVRIRGLKIYIKVPKNIYMIFGTKSNMKLLFQEHLKYKDRKYHKFWVVIPNKIIDELQWKAGVKLEAEVNEEKLIIKKGRNEKN